MNGQNRSLKCRGMVTLMAAVAVALLGLGASSASADESAEHRTREPIVGLWQVAMKGATTFYLWDAWHSDRTETQNDTGSTLGGNVCQGAWVPLGHRTYGLSHPYFIFNVPGVPGFTEGNEGEFAGASCVALERVTVNESGNNYRGTGHVKCVLGADPFDPTAHVVFTGDFKVTGKRVTVGVSQLPSAD
jgi:hypothetical protein